MLLIKNGTLVTPVTTFRADLLVEGEKIKAVGKGLTAPGAEVVDAKGLYVLPGAIDVHTHMEMPFGGTVSADSFLDGSLAAAMGGVTSFIDFAIQPKGKSLGQTLEDHAGLARGRVYVDYAFHLAVTDLTASVLREIPAVIKNGFPTLKLFMTYPAMAVDDYTLFQVLKSAAEHNGMVSVHAENLSMITGAVADLLAQGKTAPEYHEASRPDYVEAEAISRAILWAEEAGSRLYVVHLSTKKGLALIRAARQKGLSILAETCPQYLTLTKEAYREPQFGGAKYVMSPPLRAKADNDALWKGLADGTVQTVASDHCPFTMDQKKLGIHDFSKIPNGAPGIETILMLLFSQGVKKGRLTLNQLVQVTSANPAKIFGLPQKGGLEPGKDADIVLFDPGKEKVLGARTLHTKSDLSPFEGWEVKGVPVTTLVRGAFVVKDGVLVGAPDHGKLQKRILA
jgi:dihydropyrimidinase